MGFGAESYDDARDGDGCGGGKCDDDSLTSDAGTSSDAHVDADDPRAVSRGISLHVGVDHVQWSLPVANRPLSGAENDATDMRGAAAQAGFETQMLLGPDATGDEFITAIDRAAETLVTGDTFLLSFSGHGTWVPDENGDEADGRDEILALY
ncbi:MAG: caspase family protein, partial [Deltaproteobacteria bacterium]|nr:caspase family protein [Deltaproteobacteria bacterium]